MNKTISISLPKPLLILIDEVMKNRRDPTRSDTIRLLILHTLGNWSLLSTQTKKALGITSREIIHEKRTK